MFSRLISVLIIIAFFASCTSEELTPKREKISHITGIILGYDGKPMEMAHAIAYLYGKDKKNIPIQANEKGEFSIPFSYAEYMEIEFTGVNHKLYMLDIFNFGKQDDIQLKVRLEPNQFFENLSELKVIGSFNKFSFDNAAIPMVKLDDGTFKALVPNKEDTLFYQILGASPGPRSINGTMSDGYIYDGGGDYRSFLISNDSMVTITYDPRKVSFPRHDAVVTSGNKNMAHYIEIKNKLKDVYKEAMNIFTATKDTKRYFTHLFAEIKNLLSNENDQRTKLMLTRNYIDYAFRMGADADKNLIKDFMNKVGGKSAYWEKDIYLLTPGLDLVKDPAYKEKYLNVVINEHPNPIVRQRTLYDLVRSYYDKGNKSTAMKYYNILTKKYKDSPSAKMAKKEFSPDKNILIGKKIPDFSIQNIDMPGKFISANDLKGKYCLIDIWATWCGPCVGEMGNLHKTFDKFKNKNFTMLSISIDAKQSDITTFRKGKWKMPWMHSFSPGVWKSKIVELFEVSGIPQPMLIDPDGKLIELSGNLRGEELEKTIAKYVK